jgi:hypothetical protein
MRVRFPAPAFGVACPPAGVCNSGEGRVTSTTSSSLAHLVTHIFAAELEQLEARNLVATWIYVTWDNARYYRSKAVQEYLKSSRIELIFLPPYAPNLNLIERLWKFFKNKDPLQPLLGDVRRILGRL